ncbi:MAG: protein-L-isoaspartate(D-aspartate) O-methyltransferase [Chlamydiales bacterium]|nr:protein-L-isoaspartate(D-aspartate) O-methyltransferase [Chlamydiia bacterium]MCP5507839.1 protein-L-isoaspartate(D-aspartate) O-methyltransferase [Chlamydiales bacterium]
MDQEAEYALLRQRMVEEQIMRRGVSDSLTLKAMAAVKRHFFVPEALRTHAYGDGPLKIGAGQTISQPYIVALMTQAAQVDSTSTVLDIGTGSGYAAAVFAEIVDQVYSIERISELSHQAEIVLKDLGYKNIHLKVGDGTLGWPEHAPYDAIVVTAGAPVVPESLLDQLKTGGRLVIPVGDGTSQHLLRYTKTDDGEFSEQMLEYVRFVPLIGEEGWPQ